MGSNFQEIEKELEEELREIAGEEDFNKFKVEAEKETNKKIQETGEITSEEVDELALKNFVNILNRMWKIHGEIDTMYSNKDIIKDKRVRDLLDTLFDTFKKEKKKLSELPIMEKVYPDDIIKISLDASFIARFLKCETVIQLQILSEMTSLYVTLIKLLKQMLLIINSSEE